MLERGKLRGGGICATVMSNLALEKELEALGLDLVRAAVGDRYVVEAMRAGGYNLGGEQSGHIMFLDHSTTGDGLMTALQVLAVMARKDETLSHLAAGYQRYPQVIVNVGVSQKKPIEDLPTLQAAIDEVEAELDGSGRVLIRYSGTELKARVMVEGPEEGRVQEMANRLAETLKQALAAGG